MRAGKTLLSLLMLKGEAMRYEVFKLSLLIVDMMLLSINIALELKKRKCGGR